MARLYASPERGTIMPYVEGWHGTTRETTKAVLGGESLRPSRSRWDWLGDGVYFFQDSAERAWKWARERHAVEASVIRARIDLDGCLDLLQPRWFGVLEGLHDRVLSQLDVAGLTPPAQRGLAHGMDRLVINYAVGALAGKGLHIRSVRAAFAEGEPAFPGSALFSLSHVQVAVRDPAVLSELAEEVP